MCVVARSHGQVPTRCHLYTLLVRCVMISDGISATRLRGRRRSDAPHRIESTRMFHALSSFLQLEKRALRSEGVEIEVQRAAFIGFTDTLVCLEVPAPKRQLSQNPDLKCSRRPDEHQCEQSQPSTPAPKCNRDDKHGIVQRIARSKQAGVILMEMHTKSWRSYRIDLGDVQQRV